MTKRPDTTLTFVLRLDADHPYAYTERSRPVVSMTPDKHRAYAFQRPGVVFSVGNMTPDKRRAYAFLGDKDGDLMAGMTPDKRRAYAL